MAESKLMRVVDMMIHTDRMHRFLIDSNVRDIGIHRTQHRILMHLARHGKLPSQKELAEHLDITPAAVTCALKKIENDGYIKRNLGSDNRFNEISITEKGKKIVNLTEELFTNTDKSLFKGFTDEELDLYISCLEKIQNNIKNHSFAKCKPIDSEGNNHKL